MFRRRDVRAFWRRFVLPATADNDRISNPTIELRNKRKYEPILKAIFFLLCMMRFSELRVNLLYQCIHDVMWLVGVYVR